jgi:predicted TIM-barrel fold metal-dependent hydrolase
MARAVDGLDSASVTEVLACAESPNIAVKASGFYYGSAAAAEYPYPEQRQVFRRLYEAFGPRRLTWGSDSPVSLWNACTYRQALDILLVHCAEFIPDADMAAIMGDTMATMLETRRPIAA